MSVNVNSEGMVGKDFFKKYSWWVLIAILVLTGLLGWQLKDIRFDYDFEKFFPKGDVETDFFYDYRDKFESDNDFLLIAIENSNGVFDKKFLTALDRYTTAVEKANYVQYARSITNASYGTSFGKLKPYINLEDFDRKRDSVAVFSHQELLNSIVAPNGKSVCVFVRHDDYISQKKSDSLIESIQAIGEKFDFERIRIGGRTVGQQYYIHQMSTEMGIFAGMSAFLVIIFLLFAFRSAWGVLVPFIVIVTSLIWIVGGMTMTGEPINIILVVMPLIMFVVAMSDVIHFVSRYLDGVREEQNTYRAIILSIKEVGMATLMTSITTAIGFFSLYFVKVQPIQVFGITMGIGVLIAFFLTFATLPFLFYLFPGPKFVREESNNHFWKKHLDNLFTWAINNKKIILLATIVMIIVSGIGISKVETNNFLMDDMNPEEELKKDFDFIDLNFGGVRPFELAVEQTDTTKTIWDLESIQYLDSVEQYIERNYGATVKNALPTWVKIANRTSHHGLVEYEKIPSSKKKLKTLRRNLRSAGGGKFVKLFIDSTQMFTRISGSMPDLGNLKIGKLNSDLKNYLFEVERKSGLKFSITGTAHLMDKNMEYLSVSLVRGLVVSVLIVAIIIGFIYRSWAILLISMVPNVLPLLFIGGLMGYLGIELKTSTAIIFTIGFGIAVDDTIHFLGKFKHELMKGKSTAFALRRSFMTTGKAMILTTLILCAGFLMLTFSSFMGTHNLGFLLSLTLLFALIADLTLLPILLLLFFPNKKRS